MEKPKPLNIPRINDIDTNFSHGNPISDFYTRDYKQDLKTREQNKGLFLRLGQCKGKFSVMSFRFCSLDARLETRNCEQVTDMTDIRRPRRGSMAFRPRKRAVSQVAEVNWNFEMPEKRPLGFAGYKTGMSHVAYIDETESPTKGQEIIVPVTVVETPPLVVYGIRCYDNERSLGDMLIQDEKILGRAGIKKSKNKPINEDDVASVRLLVFAQPEKTSIGKKHIERMEIAVGGNNAKEKIEYAKSLLGKELKASDVFKAGEFVDAVAITKGKGWQGAVKRFGISLQRPKATGRRRHAGTTGQWHPPYILYTVPRAGQMGYHKRTELNKQIIKIGNNIDEINPKGGFVSYGFVKNDYILLKGSIPGPTKRLIRLRFAVRAKAAKEPRVTYVSLDSRQ